MKTKILTISVSLALVLCATFSNIVYAGNASKTVSSNNLYDRIYDGQSAYVEPLNGYIAYYTYLSCSNDPSSYAEILLWGDFPGYEADVYVPDSGNTTKSTSGVVYPTSTQGGWIEATFWVNGYATANLQVNW